MILYFTGTGNSKYCARLLADALQEECVDSFHYIRDGIAGEFVSQRPWVFVCPTYSWQIPRVFGEFLRSATFSGCRDAYFVMTCGGEIGNAPAANLALCREKGLICHGTFSIRMPDNYIVLFPAPKEDDIRSCLEQAGPSVRQCAGQILAGQDLPARKPGLGDRIKSGLVNQLFYRYNMQPKRFTVSQACVSCGRCERSCPLGNIRLEGGKPVWGDRCTHCMACLCGCPAEAIDYGKSTRGKARYLCPEISH